MKSAAVKTIVVVAAASVAVRLLIANKPELAKYF